MNQENQNTEYKRIWQDDNLKSICAFANSQGGVMYIGIDDEGNIESWGRGIEKIRNAGQEEGMSAPSIQTEMGGLSVRFYRAGLPQTAEANGANNTTLQPDNLTSSGSNPLKNNGDNLTTLQADNLTSLMSQIIDFCAQWRTLGEIAEHVQRSRQYLRGEVIPQMMDVLERKFDSPTHPKQQYRVKR